MAERKPLNGVSGLERFRQEWDSRRPRAGHGLENAKSEEGHINVEGKARCLSAAIFTPAAPEFWGAVEPGVRPLVTFLIERLNCITYSSCEGHPPLDGFPMRERHVGILPRDEEDRARLLAVVGAAVEAAVNASGNDRVDLYLAEDVITSEGPDVRCIDIGFGAPTHDWPSYVEKLESVQTALLEQLTAASARHCG
jgi:hypothetical protein